MAGCGPRRARWGILLLVARASNAIEDFSALVQVGTQALSQESALAAAADILRPRSSTEPVDCSSHPALCRAPFNCAKQNEALAAQLNEVGARAQSRSSSAVKSSKVSSRGLYATHDGHANMNWFCGSQEQYAMMECVAGNLSGYAQLKKLEKPRGTGDVLHRTIHELHHDMLAQFCFNMGHCNNEEVAQGMTLVQGEELCDREFGHQTWATFTEKDFEMARLLSGLGGTLKLEMLKPEGLASVKLGRPSAKAAKQLDWNAVDEVLKWTEEEHVR